MFASNLEEMGIALADPRPSPRRSKRCPVGVMFSCPSARVKAFHARPIWKKKLEELQRCFKTRGSFEGILAHKPWPHLAVSCYGDGGCLVRTGGWRTRTNTLDDIFTCQVNHSAGTLHPSQWACSELRDQFDIIQEYVSQIWYWIVVPTKTGSCINVITQK